MTTASIGFSFEKNTLPTGLFSANNHELVNLFQLLGSGVLRIGGDSVDHVAYDPTGQGGAWNVVAPPDLTGLAGFVEAAGWSVLYGTPFLFSTASSVALEATAAATALGANLRSFEFCNEPDLYPLNVMAKSAGGTTVKFNQRWSEFASAVKAAMAVGNLPDAKLTGPAYSFLTTLDVGASGFLGLTPAVSEFTQHYYCGYGVSPGSQTATQLLTDDGLLDLSLLAIPGLAGKTPPVAFRLSETNSYASGGEPGVSDTFAAALWAADLALRLGAAGAAGVNFHNSGKTYPAIEIQGDTVKEVRPLFYGLLFAAQAGAGLIVSLSPGPTLPALRAYQIHTASDGLCFALINRGGTDLTVSLPSASGTVQSAQAMWLQATSLAATSGATLGGEGVTPTGVWSANWWNVPSPTAGSPIAIPLPAYSGALVRVTMGS